MKPKRHHGWLILLLCLASFQAAPAQNILLDEHFSDWDNVPDLWSSEASAVANTLILKRFKAANDERFLFVYIKAADRFSLQNDYELTLYMDTDNNAATGLSVDGIGAEIRFNFGGRSGTFYQAGTQTEISAADLFLVSAPTVWSDQFEISFGRDVQINGSPVFTSGAVKLLLKDNSAAGISKTDAVLYTFASGVAEPHISYSITKKSAEQLRIMSQNVEFDGFFDEANKPIFDRLYDAVQPDIICFQEIYDHTPQDLTARLEEMLPSPEGESWQTAHVNDTFIASRYSIKSYYSPGGFGNGAFYLDLRPDYPTDALILSAHPPCCDNDAARQQEVDAMAAFIRDAKTEGGELQLPENTPIIITGDMNFVGDPQQVSTLLTGDIVDEGSYGADFLPDWDGAAFSQALPYTSGLPMTFTQGVRTNPGSYSKGRLDYMIYSASVLELQNEFILYTNALPQDSLTRYGLQSGDTENASDHFPLISDFKLNTEQEALSILALRENDASGVPLRKDQFLTVSAVVTVAADFGTTGPAYIQDDSAGIALYGSALVTPLTKGDSITITAKLGFYKGLTEFVFEEGSTEITVHKNTKIPQPLDVTIHDILNQEWDGTERYEGLLCRIRGVRIDASGSFAAGTNYYIIDGADTLILRIDDAVNLVGEVIPAGEDVDITGVIGQYKSSAPYNSGYQILPRSTLDILTMVSVPRENIPGRFALYQNYPNPFNPETTIAFELPAKEHVTVSVYDMYGKKIATLLNKEMRRGRHHIAFDGQNLSSGVYVYSISANTFHLAKKMILIK